MARLNQIIAIEKGVKARTHGIVSEMYKQLLKPELFNGLTRNYQPKDEDGETLPAERKNVQFSVPVFLDRVEAALGELMDLTSRKDWTNCVAKGDVVVDGRVLIPGAPVSFLLFLEKQLNDLRTFADTLPVLDDAEEWTTDPNTGMYRTAAIQTYRNRKVPEVVVMYPATDQHPAQTQLLSKDVLAGIWTAVKHSGAIPKPDKEALVQRIEKLSRAVKQAREAANIADEVETPKAGNLVFSYLLGR